MSLLCSRPRAPLGSWLALVVGRVARAEKAVAAKATAAAAIKRASRCLRARAASSPKNASSRKAMGKHAILGPPFCATWVPMLVAA